MTDFLITVPCISGLLREERVRCKIQNTWSSGQNVPARNLQGGRWWSLQDEVWPRFPAWCAASRVPKKAAESTRDLHRLQGFTCDAGSHCPDLPYTLYPAKPTSAGHCIEILLCCRWLELCFNCCEMCCADVHNGWMDAGIKSPGFDISPNTFYQSAWEYEGCLIRFIELNLLNMHYVVLIPISSRNRYNLE